jgi:hypothetical protein
MFSSITPAQAKALRAGGYLALVVAFLSAINWILVIREYSVMEHQWPAASATVYSMREDSREVTPPSSRQHSYQVYWVQFMVVLDLPQGQCPGSMVPLTSAEPQCTAEVKTPEVKSRADAIVWFSRHPRNSRLVVHYDAQSGRMVLGGESIFDIYPWDKIAITAVAFVIAALMLIAGRSQTARPEYPQGVPEVKEE